MCVCIYRIHKRLLENIFARAIGKLLSITLSREKRGDAKRFKMRRVKGGLTPPRNPTAGKRREICICRLVSRFYEKHLFTRTTPVRPFPLRYLSGSHVVHRYANSSAISFSIGCNQPSRRPCGIRPSRELSMPFFSHSYKVL